MFHKRFNFLIVLRVLLLVGNVFLLTWIFGDERLFFNQLIVTAALIGQVVELIYFLNHTNRQLTRFFVSIKHADYSVSFREKKLGKSFKLLNESFTDIIESFKKVKIEKEIQYQFLQNIVEQIHVGIISLEGNKITLINSTAEKLLNLEGAQSRDFFTQLNFAVAKELHEIGDQGRKLIDIRMHGESRMISVDINTMIIQEKAYKLITLQDINSEIEQKEIEAWHKLIRILTHEIMNSVTPIASLTETMQDMLTVKKGKTKDEIFSEETISDLRFSLNTIQKRSDGLLNFVENYRKFSRIPKPVKQRIEVAELLTAIQLLMKEEMVRHDILLEIAVNPTNLVIQCDVKLIEQVIINLITNSIHALDGREHKKITMNAFKKETYVIIEVSDNGAGIAEKELKEIFIPFFSTKKEGSGIGLSLSKQIMSLHGGSITVTSKIDAGATFFLQFR